MNGVKCMCEECNYNEKHECNADNIEVRSNGDNKVHSSAGTCCSTFKPKNSTCGCKH
jgi:hypothetical protein